MLKRLEETAKLSLSRAHARWALKEALWRALAIRTCTGGSARAEFPGLNKPASKSLRYHEIYLSIGVEEAVALLSGFPNRPYLRASVGSTSRFSTVEVASPPRITIAIGPSISRVAASLAELLSMLILANNCLKFSHDPGSAFRRLFDEVDGL